MSDFNPDWASPPWNTIADIIEEKGLPESVYVPLLGLTGSGLEQIKQGDMPIVSAFAKQLSEVMGSSKEFWLNREIQYRYARNRLDAERIQELEARVAELETTPTQPREE